MADREKVINALQFALDGTAVTGWGFAQVHKETVIDALELLRAQEEIKTESDIVAHIIGEICDFAVKNNMKPDDLLSNMAETILNILDALSFNNWEQKKEGDPE